MDCGSPAGRPASPHFSYPFVARRREDASRRGASRISRRAVPAELYENILPKGDPGRNEAGAGRSKSQQKGYEKCGLGDDASIEVARG